MIRFTDIEAALARKPSCPKLGSLEGCGYKKSVNTCSQRKQLRSCPLPLYRLRKGSLNESAYSLFLFIRNIYMVGWIDHRLAAADQPGAPDRAARMRAAVLEPLQNIAGLGPKVLAMALADLLLGPDPARERWVATGAAMIAIGSLVHNILHRTGTLRRFGTAHPYGPACYGPNGCAEIIEGLASRIDTRQFNPEFPACFPGLMTGSDARTDFARPSRTATGS